MLMPIVFSVLFDIIHLKHDIPPDWRVDLMEKRQVGSLNFSIDFSQPLHEQILAQMRSFIARGVAGPGDKLPSVREMAQELKINPNTVMHAYQELERDGLTEKRRGQGTFVTTSLIQVREFKDHLAAAYTREFVDRMLQLGLSRQTIQDYLSQQKGSNEHDRTDHYR